MWNPLLLLVIGLICPPETVAGPPPLSTPPSRVAVLIAQLGSDKFKERATAAAALDEIGQPALALLRAAAKDADPEVRRRAEALAKQIQRRIETAELLQARLVRLTFDDLPLREAIAEFARKTGFPLQLRNGGDDRRITLNTGDTTVWQAFDQFCQKAELVEQPMTVAVERTVQYSAGRNGAVIITQAPSFSGAVSQDGRFTLASGKPAPAPTCYSGAVRIRAVPPKPQNGQPAKNEALVVLQVSPEPKLAWQTILDVRVDRAIDEHGQSLVPVSPNSEPETRTGRVNGAQLFEARIEQVWNDPRETPVRLRLADKRSKVLQEFRGAVSAQVQTAVQPLVQVDNLFKAVGQVVKGEHGDTMKVLEAARRDDDAIKVRVLLDTTRYTGHTWAVNRRAVLRGNRIIVRNGMVVGGGVRETSIFGDGSMVLADAQGRSYRLVEANYNMVFNGNGLAQDLQLVYRPNSGQGEPVKLTYSNRRIIVVEVPFHLKDVGLP